MLLFQPEGEPQGSSGGYLVFWTDSLIVTRLQVIVCSSPGQVLDEVLQRCVDPAQCQVCLHKGERISHGKQIILNHDDPHLCQIWYVPSSVGLIQSLNVNEM